jgi:phosphoribosylformylglycinamidine synthase
MALASGIGAEVQPAGDGVAMNDDRTLAAALFGEDQGRYIITVAKPLAIKELAQAAGTDALFVGVTGFIDAIDHEEGVWVEEGLGPEAFVSLDELRRSHEGFFPKLMGKELHVA